MRLLIVGASGFIGRNLVQAAVAAGWTVAGTYAHSPAFPAFAERLEAEAIRHEFGSPPPRWDADVCVYLAGNSDHRRARAAPLDDLRANAEGLVEFLSGYQGGLVFMSSAEVYQGLRGRVSPEVRIDPRMPYSISKLACEQYVKFFALRGSLSWYTILRLYYAFGPYDRPTRLIPRLVAAAQEGRREFTVTAPAGSLLDPLYVDDVCATILAAAEGRAKWEIFDVCGGQPRTVPRLAQEVLGILGADMALVDRPDPTEPPFLFHSDPAPARLRFGPSTPLPLETGVRKYADWVRGAEIQDGPR